jgi:hypothetical protein
MSVRPLLYSVLTLCTALPLAAQERYTYTGRAASQTADEIEDIGEIAETSSETVDGKTVGEPEPDLRSKFRLSASTRATYTSNAQLSGNHGSGDFLFFPTIEGGFNTMLRNGFTFDVAARIDSGLYARYDERAFIGYGLTTTLDWRPKPNAPRLFISAEPYRYDNFDKGGKLTQAIGMAAGTDWGIPFNNGNSMAFVGYNFTHYLSDPSMDSRNAHRAVVGVTHTIRPQVYGQMLYAFNYDNYTDFDRRDFRHVIAANLTWQVNRHLFTTLSGTFIDNDSDQLRASYQSAGAALQLTWQF